LLPSHFMVIEDGIPSLALAVSEDETYLADAKIRRKGGSYWGAIKETLRYPDKTVRIAKLQQGGEITVYQVWRVGFSGKAFIPPARAFDMYDDNLQGNTSALEIEVE
jgi:alpha-2-macroglobulin